MDNLLPLFVKGKVVSGFGRGSKQLGIPTANLPEEVVNSLPKDLKTGVYFGFALLEKHPVHKMVMSVGWNPYYKNKQKSMEVHIMHKFDEDFYEQELKVAILGYIREEKNFSSLEELIRAINNDISTADYELEKPEFQNYARHDFFKNN